jgi:hypothetical protein
MGLERVPLSLVSTTEELLDRKVAALVYKTDNTDVGIHHADHVAPSIHNKLAITSPTSCGRSVGIVRLRTQIMEFSLVLQEDSIKIHVIQIDLIMMTQYVEELGPLLFANFPVNFPVR